MSERKFEVGDPVWFYRESEVRTRRAPRPHPAEIVELVPPMVPGDDGCYRLRSPDVGGIFVRREDEIASRGETKSGAGT